MKYFFQKKIYSKKGFTLMEILLVIGIIATLAVIVFVVLDPAGRFQDARNARRRTDVETISSAIHQYIIDNKGTLPDGIQSAELQIGKQTDNMECAYYSDYCNVGNNECLDLSNSLAKYLKTIPFDSQNGSEFTTHYMVQMDENFIITVRACDAEGGNDISVSR
jgi:prepilin-type N-terminal cleavage/methylation domain-containing protein